MRDIVPAFAFSIPSLQDDTSLECRIYHPQHGVAGYPWRKAAVVAHPYAPLGGCFDDPVVLCLVDELIDNDYVVGTFNFRYKYLFGYSCAKLMCSLVEWANQKVTHHGPRKQRYRTIPPLPGSWHTTSIIFNPTKHLNIPIHQQAQ